jgi:hypothetical protein
MTKQKITIALWGLLTVLLGIAALAYNFGALDDYKLVTAYSVAGLLAFMGAAFLVLIVFQRDQWFYIIPGFSLLSLGGVVYLTTLQNIKPEWQGALFLGGIALGFLIIFLRQRQERWWALLQAETIFIIALVGLGLGIPPEATSLVGAILFGGFAVSFFFVWLFSGHRARFVWSLILAVVLAAFAAAILATGHNTFFLSLWPVALLLIGVFLLARAFSSGGKKQQVVTPVESLPLAPDSEPAQDDAPAQIMLPDTQHPQTDAEPELEIIEPEEIDEASVSEA